MRTPIVTERRTEKAPCLESPNSVHVKGLLTWNNTFWNCSFRSSSDPVLSITMSALLLFKSSDIWAFILFLASSSDVLSLANSRWSCVSGSTHTTIMGFVQPSILASNNKGTSRTITLNPFIHSLKTSQKIPDDIKGASSLKMYIKTRVKTHIIASSLQVKAMNYNQLTLKKIYCPANWSMKIPNS